jgi:thiamine biosynthesis lipoprotein
MLETPCLVNGGGDVRVRGRPPGDATWRVGVASPFDPDTDLLVFNVIDRGVATSSSLRRGWRVGDAYLHHLIDPRTGRPSASDAVQVTVIAPTTLEADYHAKVALLQGAAAGVAYLDGEAGIEAVVIRRDGTVLRTMGFGDYL